MNVSFISLRKILDAYKYQDQYSKAKTLSESHMLCVLLNRFRHGGDIEEKQSRPMQELVNRIRKNPSGDWTHELMAQTLSVSPSTFHRVFKKEFNCPPITLVIRERFGFVMELLTHTKQLISLIAQSCGYESDFSFMRLFRKHIGMTEGEYRERNYLLEG